MVEPLTANATTSIPILDCDSHWTEPTDLWTSRAPRSLRDRVPRVGEVDGVQSWRVGNIELGPIGLSVIRPDGEKVLGRLYLPHQRELHAAWDPAARLRMLDALGMLFETDFPHPTCLYPAPRARLDRALATLDVDSRHALLHRNAERLYGAIETGAPS
jgi:hypothetical protein